MIDRFDGDNRFLSNFYKWAVRFEGIVYPSVECAFQAAKTTDVDLRIDFIEVKLGIMEQLLTAKFSDKPMRQKLMATGNQQLVEGNDWKDLFWGVCDGVGENHLGQLLMKVRDQLRRT
jgi:predicted NAD-dependent protein-ADP-ribosyltransferase YbiA (DUF1768 family)